MESPLTMTPEQLSNWLRENSSGVYRPARDAAEYLDHAMYLLGRVYESLPSNKDWLDPEVEKMILRLLSGHSHFNPNRD